MATFPTGQVVTRCGDVFVNKSQLGQTAYLDWTGSSGTYNADSEPTAADTYVVRVALAPTVLSFLLPNAPRGYSACVANRSDSLGQIEVRSSAAVLLATLPPGASYRGVVFDSVSQAWNEASGGSAATVLSLKASSFLLQPASVNRFALWSDPSGNMNIRSSAGLNRCEAYSVTSNGSGEWTLNISSIGFSSPAEYIVIATAVTSSNNFRAATVTNTTATTVTGQTWNRTTVVLAGQTLVLIGNTQVRVTIVY